MKTGSLQLITKRAPADPDSQINYLSPHVYLIYYFWTAWMV